MKATELYFPVVLFTMLFKVAPAFESVDEILTMCESLIKSSENVTIHDISIERY